MEESGDSVIEAQLARAVDEAPVAFFLAAPDGQFLYANNSFSTITGFSVSEILSMSMSDFDVMGDQSHAARHRDVLASGAVARVRRRRPLNRKDGGLIWIDITGNPVLDESGRLIALAGQAVDVSAEVMALARVDELDRRLHGRTGGPSARELVNRAVNDAPIGQGILTATSILVDANQALCRLLGRRRDDLVGSALPDLCSTGSDVAMRLWELGQGHTEDLVLEEVPMVHGDGRQVWVRIYAKPVAEAEAGVAPAWLVCQFLDITRERQAQQRARELQTDLTFRTNHDHLTGALSRAALLEGLSEALANADDKDGRVAVLFVDIDQFKTLNDGLSHAAGDLVLRCVAATFEEAVSEPHLLGRIGGDEFVCVLPHTESPQQAISVAERVRARLAERAIEIDDRRVWITVSMGVALSGPTESAADLLQEADMALNAAKRSGRNRWMFFDEAMRSRSHQSLDVASQLRQSIESGDFTAWYQPQRDLRTGAVVGFEALARWEHGGAVTPAAQFLDVAEDRGYLIPIGTQVHRAALRAAAVLPSTVRMAVNVSAREILAPDFLDRMTALIESSQIDPRRVVLELAERTVLQSVAAAESTLMAITDLGMAIHVDDYGAGYSSLTHLRDLPIAGVKLDSSFTTALDTQDGASVSRLVGGIADLVDRLGLERICEGVETAAQRDALLDLGWPVGQGRFLGEVAPTCSVAPVSRRSSPP